MIATTSFFWQSLSPLESILAGILGILVVLLTILVVNLCTFHRLTPGAATTFIANNNQLPLVSVLIPARNEEQRIEACVRSLVQQHYPCLEVLVLDDNSTDTTAAIVQQIIETLPPEQQGRLHLLKGEALPAGWTGKNFACYQLYQAARADYLLFTDADTIHEPESVGALIECIQRYKVSFLSAQPEQVFGSRGERLILPLFNFSVLTLLPIPLVYLRPEPSLAMGNGQLLCFQRSAYERIGGHAAVKNRVLDDVLLARACKAAGLRIIFVDAFNLIRCRMYHSFAEVWSGFSKNLFALYNNSLPFAIIALLLNLTLFVVPPLLVLLALIFSFAPLTLTLAAVAYLLAVLMRVLLTLRMSRGHMLQQIFFCVLHPIAIVIEGLILLNSIRWHYSKTGIQWKGRFYQ